ncbi:MAG: hypothetical protein BGN89_07775 [Alphaproteobacteria bacterium 64-6]|jgi:hypothetical protein|nr:MAG: hypothetical protein BGN89_07775 [Alphaproteobacteria bacterium 64-6]
MRNDRRPPQVQAGSQTDACAAAPFNEASQPTDPAQPGHAAAHVDTAAQLRTLQPSGKRQRRFTGRPPAPPGVARTLPVTVKLSDQDRHRIEQRALKAGLPITTYMREAALKARVTPPRGAGQMTLAEMAEIAQLHELAVIIAREANRLSRPGALPASALEAFDKLTQLTSLVTDRAAARDREDAHRQRIIAELGHIGRNLNQIARGVNAIVRRRGTVDEALPPFTRAVLADIASLLERLPDKPDPTFEADP